MDNYMIGSYNKDNRMLLDQHQYICENLDKSLANMLTVKLNELKDFQYINNLLFIHRHAKTCPLHEQHIAMRKSLRENNFNYYYRKVGSPVYVLAVKLLNEGREGGGAYSIVDYFYQLEDLEKAYLPYEEMVLNRKLLSKVLVIDHPLDIIPPD